MTPFLFWLAFSTLRPHPIVTRQHSSLLVMSRSYLPGDLSRVRSLASFCLCFRFSADNVRGDISKDAALVKCEDLESFVDEVQDELRITGQRTKTGSQSQMVSAPETAPVQALPLPPTPTASAKVARKKTSGGAPSPKSSPATTPRKTLTTAARKMRPKIVKTVLFAGYSRCFPGDP